METEPMVESLIEVIREQETPQDILELMKNFPYLPEHLSEPLEPSPEPPSEPLEHTPSPPSEPLEPSPKPPEFLQLTPAHPEVLLLTPEPPGDFQFTPDPLSELLDSSDVYFLIEECISTMGQQNIPEEDFKLMDDFLMEDNYPTLDAGNKQQGPVDYQHNTNVSDSPTRPLMMSPRAMHRPVPFYSNGPMELIDGPSTSSASSAPRNKNSRKRKRDDSEPRIKKPPNAFMIYRGEHMERVKAELQIKNSAQINIILGERWQNMSQEEKSVYFQQADVLKREHAAKYPDWKPNCTKKVKKGVNQQQLPQGVIHPPQDHNNLPQGVNYLPQGCMQLHQGFVQGFMLLPQGFHLPQGFVQPPRGSHQPPQGIHQPNTQHYLLQ